jgi:hypothetical protein
MSTADQNMQSVAPGMPFKQMTFIFEEGNNTIQVWYRLNGKEIVSVNGRVISCRWQFKLNSTHPFDLDGVPYSLDMRVQLLSKGPQTCTLSRDGKPVQRQHLLVGNATTYEQPSKDNLRRRMTQFLVQGGVWFAVSFLIFNIQKYLQLPKMAAYTALAALVLGYMVHGALRTPSFSATLMKERLGPPDLEEEKSTH